MTRRKEFVFNADLRTAIKDRLDGFQPGLVDDPELRHAAVGVVVLPDADGQACFVLTRRQPTLRRHAGQWALPGGRLEPGESAEAAALREIQEEINLLVEPDALLGRLDDFITRSRYLITPVVVWAADRTALAANPDEVADAYLVPLADLDDPRAVQMGPLLHLTIPSVPTTVYAPTAAILYQFREVALHGREIRVAEVEQPFFAWR
jgi:8-oxo-dGTP pyrophosphatase MutT (NUDIX family)